ncbi:MAG: hypothetical protein QNI84_04375 [Henriciella sp.]|nr:hypothetical protein [Henriciella sp.]
MKYDVFLVNALADSAKADMLVKRLRALKFKVRHDKKREHTTPTPRDYRDADNARTILVLWSKAACDSTKRDSDWVHAIAHHARSKQSVLVQSVLDTTVPDEPFNEDDRYALKGLTEKTTVAPYYKLVDDLGGRAERSGLSEWLKIKPRDKAAKDAWKAAHAEDPIALVGKPKPKPAAKPVDKPLAETRAAAAPAAATATTKPVQPKAPPMRPVVQPAASPYQSAEDKGVGHLMVGGIAAGIALMFLFGYLVRSQPLNAGIANAGPNFALQCPPGQVPSSLLDVLEPSGPIVDDTE